MSDSHKAETRLPHLYVALRLTESSLCTGLPLVLVLENRILKRVVQPEAQTYLDVEGWLLRQVPRSTYETKIEEMSVLLLIFPLYY
jgi:hypothetical protein